MIFTSHSNFVLNEFILCNEECQLLCCIPNSLDRTSDSQLVGILPGEVAFCAMDGSV